jgi:hypothetical protein
MAKDARIPIFPPPGIYRGATPDVSAARWYDQNLMRWRGGQAQPVGGWGSLYGIGLSSPPRDVLTWHDNGGHRWGAFGCDTGLFAVNLESGAVYDITPTGVGPLEPPGAALGFGLGDYGVDAWGTARDPSDIGVSDISPLLGDMWSMDLFGEDLMILPTQDGRLFRWSPATPATAPALVTGAPTGNACVVVTDERHVVLVGAGGNSRDVAWSDQENPDVWTPAVDNLAGDKQLTTEGRPVNAMRVASGVMIWTDNDAHLMRYVGPPYAYGINRVGANCGPISRRSMAQAGGITQWMGQQTFWQYDGSISALPSDVGDWLFSMMNRDMVGRIFAVPNPSFGEIWYFWPDEGSDECNRYVGDNYVDGRHPWIIGQLSRTAGDVKGAMLRPILTTIDGKIMLHEYGWTNDGASRLGTVYLETGTYTISDGADQRFIVKQTVQDFVGPTDRVAYRFFFWEEPDGPEWDTGSIPVVNTTGRTDMGDGFSCRGMRMRIEAVSDGPFAIGKTRLIAVAAGFV